MNNFIFLDLKPRENKWKWFKKFKKTCKQNLICLISFCLFLLKKQNLRSLLKSGYNYFKDVFCLKSKNRICSKVHVSFGKLFFSTLKKGYIEDLVTKFTIIYSKLLSRDYQLDTYRFSKEKLWKLLNYFLIFYEGCTEPPQKSVFRDRNLKTTFF